MGIKICFYREHAFVTHILQICCDPDIFTIATVFRKCGLKSALAVWVYYIFKVHLELPCSKTKQVEEEYMKVGFIRDDPFNPSGLLALIRMPLG